MDTNEGAVKRISGPQLWTVKDSLDMDEAYPFIIALIDQNAELSGRVEYLDSCWKWYNNRGRSLWEQNTPPSPARYPNQLQPYSWIANAESLPK